MNPAPDSKKVEAGLAWVLQAEFIFVCGRGWGGMPGWKYPRVIDRTKHQSS